MMSEDKNSSEDEIYHKNIGIIRSNIANGVKFDLACEFLDVGDKRLKGTIIDDALKIEIAELHFGKGMPLLDVSRKLGVPMERLLRASNEMIEEIGETTAEIYRKKQGGSDLTH